MTPIFARDAGAIPGAAVLNFMMLMAASITRRPDDANVT
jgi:hypothetical protein